MASSERQSPLDRHTPSEIQRGGGDARELDRATPEPSGEISVRGSPENRAEMMEDSRELRNEIVLLRRRLDEEKTLRRQEENKRNLLSKRVQLLKKARQQETVIQEVGDTGSQPSRLSSPHNRSGIFGDEDSMPGSREKLLECVQQHIKQCQELDKELNRERAARWSALQSSMETDNALEKAKELEDALKEEARWEAQSADMEHRAWVADLNQIQMQAMQKRRDVHALQLLIQKEEARRRQLIQEIASVQEMKERAMKYIDKRAQQFGRRTGDSKAKRNIGGDSS